MLNSMVCRAEHFDAHWFENAALSFGLFKRDAEGQVSKNIHRKVWEWVVIGAVLLERDKLSPGRRGIGFAVGKEPMSSIFAKYGVEILASDLAKGEASLGWSNTNQHADNLDALYFPDIVERHVFEKNVAFQAVDMNDIEHLPKGEFDFAWSSCSLEHLGSLQAGMDFIKNSVKLLKPGGVAVHTTEFNLTSDDETVEEGDTVIYRESDLRKLDRDLRSMDAGLERLDLWGGCHEYDIKADYEPYHANGRHHLKLRIGNFVATSVVLIVQN